jgi:hypothetical protein
MRRKTFGDESDRDSYHVTNHIGCFVMIEKEAADTI